VVYLGLEAKGRRLEGVFVGKYEKKLVMAALG
jgi:hypothetical protein